MNIQRTLTAAKDSISQFLSRRYPLKNVANDVIARRKLNSRERRALFDIVFRFCRERFLFERFVAECIPFSSGMPVQEKNNLALEVFAESLGHGSGGSIVKLMNDYDAYVTTLGDSRDLFALSPFMRASLIKDFGDEASAIAKGMLSRPAKYLAYDRNAVSKDDVIAALAKHQIETFSHPRLPTAIGTRDEIDLDEVLPKEMRDHVWMMDAGSQIVAELVVPKPSDRVLDMCAGEGNKARYITMHDCDFVAADIDEARLKKTKARLAHKKINYVVGDGRSLDLPLESFDWILLDAPCTGTGVLRRHPDLMHRLEAKDLNESLKLQQQLLDSAIKLLKPDGVLIYATCSVFRAENDLQISAWLKKNSRVKPFALDELVGERIKLASEAVSNNSMNLFPHIDDCDGFFVAAIKKCNDVIA